MHQVFGLFLCFKLFWYHLYSVWERVDLNYAQLFSFSYSFSHYYFLVSYNFAPIARNSEDVPLLNITLKRKEEKKEIHFISTKIKLMLLELVILKKQN